jgi:hypothetical protein
MFTLEEVESLNAYQKARVFHPFTCGSGNRTDSKHLDGEGILVATTEGWVCPYCEYRQDWAHDFMKNGSWKTQPPWNLVKNGQINSIFGQKSS